MIHFLLSSIGVGEGAGRERGGGGGLGPGSDGCGCGSSNLRLPSPEQHHHFVYNLHSQVLLQAPYSSNHQCIPDFPCPAQRLVAQVQIHSFSVTHNHKTLSLCGKKGTALTAACLTYSSIPFSHWGRGGGRERVEWKRAWSSHPGWMQQQELQR